MIEPSIPHMMIVLHDALSEAAIDHAFGGALALAWCTEQARGTIDVDLNVFVPVARSGDVLDAFPDAVAWTNGEARTLARDGQVRLRWGTTPIDLFLSTTDFHRRAAARVRWEPFAGADLPFLSCDDVAVFKAFFDRTKDWADLEAMQDAGTLDVPAVAGVLVALLGGDDARVARLLSLSARD
jgi:hypothetical protein